MSFKTLKVFDCQEMPPEVRRMWFDHHHDAMVHTYNGSYLGWTIADEIFDEETPAEWAQRKTEIDAWLISQGAEAPPNEDESGEEVLVHYHW